MVEGGKHPNFKPVGHTIGITVLIGFKVMGDCHRVFGNGGRDLVFCLPIGSIFPHIIECPMGEGIFINRQVRGDRGYRIIDILGRRGGGEQTGRVGLLLKGYLSIRRNGQAK